MVKSINSPNFNAYLFRYNAIQTRQSWMWRRWVNDILRGISDEVVRSDVIPRTDHKAFRHADLTGPAARQRRYTEAGLHFRPLVDPGLSSLHPGHEERLRDHERRIAALEPWTMDKGASVKDSTSHQPSRPTLPRWRNAFSGVNQLLLHPDVRLLQQVGWLSRGKKPPSLKPRQRRKTPAIQREEGDDIWAVAPV